MLSQFLLKLEFFLKDMLVKDLQAIKNLQELDDNIQFLESLSCFICDTNDRIGSKDQRLH